MTSRVSTLEAQINALSQAFLRLAAMTEVAGVVDHDQLITSLKVVSWPGYEQEAEAQRTMFWLADELHNAYLTRMRAFDC